MHFSSVLLAAAALAFSAEATPTGSRRSDPHVLDFRIWSDANCGVGGDNQGNLGVTTITQSQTGVCRPSFSSNPEDLPHVRGIYLNRLTSGCTMTAYTSSGCQGAGTSVGVQQCAEPADSRSIWVSYRVDCPSA
ncbi:hypothetical protein Cob_v003513 [Colletotrichum orbiculare MAFF 240422]|uniref:Uncharacterized protein n=1 Tax=Colletotrichum orbiculare (strain 104-T / ATCC 96160 / CBS 514.97 / LARS 414 / MAFF 240422) TaxID=1213857 RepID=N4W1R4_COLOR|nr:hypothetical protein Cob_v003513 [Colletotrichum orbiculare MAFF 240422]